jgi:thiol:disulfide interchange protein DsbA
VNYFRLDPAQSSVVPADKVEVTEVFSYACPACNQFSPIMKMLKAGLPANAVIDYLPASFNHSEDWPMFQRAFFAAQSLGVAEKAHNAMYDAVWKSGELAVVDPTTQRLKSTQPSIEDAARFYERITGVSQAQFLAAAKSFAVDLKVRAADDQVIRMQVDRTPTLIVAGKYRLHVQSAGGIQQLIDLVKYLVARESPAPAPAVAPPAAKAPAKPVRASAKH